jgi:hypothetical protein
MGPGGGKYCSDGTSDCLLGRRQPRAAQSAARWNPPLRRFYERLVSRGKSKKAALAAVARKLLIAINAMMRDQRPWPTDSSQDPIPTLTKPGLSGQRPR